MLVELSLESSHLIRLVIKFYAFTEPDRNSSLGHNVSHLRPIISLTVFLNIQFNIIFQSIPITISILATARRLF